MKILVLFLVLASTGEAIAEVLDTDPASTLPVGTSLYFGSETTLRANTRYTPIGNSDVSEETWDEDDFDLVRESELNMGGCFVQHTTVTHARLLVTNKEFIMVAVEPMTRAQHRWVRLTVRSPAGAALRVACFVSAPSADGGIFVRKIPTVATIKAYFEASFPPPTIIEE